MKKQSEEMVLIPKELAKRLYSESKELSFIFDIIHVYRDKLGKYMPLIIDYSDDGEIEEDISSLITEKYGMCSRIGISEKHKDAFIELGEYIDEE